MEIVSSCLDAEDTVQSDVMSPATSKGNLPYSYRQKRSDFYGEKQINLVGEEITLPRKLCKFNVSECNNAFSKRFYNFSARKMFNCEN